MLRRELLACAAALSLPSFAGAREPAGSTAQAAAGTMTVTSKDGTTIAYDRHGSGDAIILVSGAMQYRGSDPFTPQLIEKLAAQFSVYFYDRRGRGESGDTQPYAVAREIEDIAALIGVAGGRASLFGMSSGAVLAVEAAASGIAVDRLALYEPPFIVDDSRPGFPDDYVEVLDGFVQTGRRSEAVEYFFAAAVGLPAEQIAAMKGTSFWSEMERVAHTIAYDGRIMMGAYQNRQLPKSRWSTATMPALVLDGSASFPFMHAAADSVAAALPHARRQTLDGQTHGAAPEVLAPVLQQFFAT